MNFKGKIREKSGITLITLVVTIIILLILAGITIATITSDNGIIKNANDAKEQTEIAEEKEIVDKAIIQVMGNNKYGNIDEDELQNELDTITGKGKTEVSNIGEIIKILFKDSNRNYAVDKDGNVRKMIWWEINDENDNRYVTNGKEILQIGDYINYDANDNGEYIYTAEADKTGVSSGEVQRFSSSYDTNWRLLGVEHGAEGDYLKLVPDIAIQSTGFKGLILRGPTGYKYGIEEIENICKIYGYGTGAIRVKAMTVEDMNQITGYDPVNTGDGNIYGKGNLCEYLNEIVCTRKQFGYTVMQGKNGSVANFTYNAFRYYDESSESIKDLNVGETITLKTTFYKYVPTTLTEQVTGETKGIYKTSKEYLMLFNGRKNYWLASRYILVGDTFTATGEAGLHAVFYDNSIYSETVSGSGVLYAGNPYLYVSHNIMPIVFLDTDIKLRETGNYIDSCKEWEIIIDHP